jgi:xanthine/uracil permease
MGVVGEWTNESMPPPRLSAGVLSMMLGSAIAASIGSFTNLPYPANVAILRSTGVASRWVTATTGVILVLIGFCTKLDYVFVLLPTPVLSAAATVLFGIVFVHGVELLARVDWDERSLAIAGFTLMLGFGCLFVEPKTLAAMPLVISLLLRQPIIVGVFSLLVLTVVLPGAGRAVRAAEPTVTRPSASSVAAE